MCVCVCVCVCACVCVCVRVCEVSVSEFMCVRAPIYKRVVEEERGNMEGVGQVGGVRMEGEMRGER